MANSQEWRLRFWLTADGSQAVVPPSVPPRLSFREGDTFAPARILVMEEPLAVLYGTSQALACCALASPELNRGDSHTIPLKVPLKQRA
jgi:hypothetical protein